MNADHHKVRLYVKGWCRYCMDEFEEVIEVDPNAKVPARLPMHPGCPSCRKRFQRRMVPWRQHENRGETK